MTTGKSRLVSPVVKLSKQKIITGVIVDVLGSLCSVRLSGQGAVLHSLRFIGTAPAVGDSVLVDYRSGVPVVHTNADNLDEAVAEMQRTITAATASVSGAPPELTISGSELRVVDESESTDVPGAIELRFPDGALVDNGEGSVSVKIERMIIFATEGALSVQTGAIRLYNGFGSDFTITKVLLAVGTAPTGSAIIVDINKNGTTIFTTQSNRPQIAASANSGQSTTIENAAFEIGDYLTMDIDQKGSTIAGSDLSVHIFFS